MFPPHAYTKPEVPKTNGVTRSFGISASPGPISYPVNLDKQFNLSETHFLWHQKKKRKEEKKKWGFCLPDRNTYEIKYMYVGGSSWKAWHIRKKIGDLPKLLPPFPYHIDPENVNVEILTF